MGRFCGLSRVQRTRRGTLAGLGLCSCRGRAPRALLVATTEVHGPVARRQVLGALTASSTAPLQLIPDQEVTESHVAANEAATRASHGPNSKKKALVSQRPPAPLLERRRTPRDAAAQLNWIHKG